MAARTSSSVRTPVGSGDRDRLVTIAQLTPSAGSSGFPVEDWTTLPTFTMWAYTSPQGGRERFVSDQLSAPYDTRWEVDYRPDMDPELVDIPKTRRLVYLGRTYDIVDASMIGRRDGIELLTLARQG